MDIFIVTLSAILDEKIRQSLLIELALLRELFSNLEHESRSLSQGNKTRWNEIMASRFMLLERIKQVRADRGNELCSPDAFDIHLLQEQILILMQKIHDVSALISKDLVAIPYALPYPEPIISKRKNALLTL